MGRSLGHPPDHHPGHECHADLQDRTGNHCRSLLVLSVLFILSEISNLKSQMYGEILANSAQAACLRLFRQDYQEKQNVLLACASG
jgi:hypothetical protein